MVRHNDAEYGSQQRRSERVQSTPSKLTEKQKLTELGPAGEAMIEDDASGAGRSVESCCGRRWRMSGSGWTEVMGRE